MQTVVPSSSNALHEGWLYRPKSFFLGGNSKRFVVIDRNYISQYKSVEDRRRRVPKPTEVTELQMVRCCVRTGSRRFALQLLRLPTEKGASVDFVALNRSDNDMWLQKVESALGYWRSSVADRCSVTEINACDDMMTRTTASPSVCSLLHSELSINVSGSRQRSSPSSQRPSFAGSQPSIGANGASPSRSAPQRGAGQRHALGTSNRAPNTASTRHLPNPHPSERNLQPGTRVQFGEINRFGIIEDDLGSNKFLVRVEGSSVILPLPADLLSCASDDHRSLQRSLTSISARSHEPPAPQHLANESGAVQPRKGIVSAEKQRKLNYAMRHLIVEKYSAARSGKDSDDTEHECSICCMEYEEGEERLRLPCLHVFHDVCVRPWFNDHESCPVCDISVVEALSL